MIKILNVSETSPAELFERVTQSADVSEVVSDIIENVRKNGDKALFYYTEKFDGAKLSSLEVTEDEMNDALMNVSPEFLGILYEAADNIRSFHKNQVRSGFVVSDKPGVVMGQKVIPLEKVGFYVPGGTAAYPSSVLMDSIPASWRAAKRSSWSPPAERTAGSSPRYLRRQRSRGYRESSK